MAIKALPVYKREEQLLATLCQIAPPDTWLLLVSCQPGPAGDPVCASTYLTRSAGGWHAGSLSALPMAIWKRFQALSQAMRNEHPGCEWGAYKVTVPLDLLEAYQHGFVQKVEYGFRTAREGSGDPTDYAAASNELPTPAQLLALVQEQSGEQTRAKRLNSGEVQRTLLEALLPALPPDCCLALVRQEPEPTNPAEGLRGIGDEARVTYCPNYRQPWRRSLPTCVKPSPWKPATPGSASNCWFGQRKTAG